MPPRPVLPLIVASIVAVASSAHGSPPDDAAPAPAAGSSQPDDRRSQAEECFERGREVGAAGRWAEAASWFERSLRLQFSPESLYSLGVAQRRSGLKAEALNTFRRFLALPPPKELDRFVAASREAVRELEPEVAQLRIVDPVERVLVDGEPTKVSASSAPLAVAPGPHVVQITTADGRMHEDTIVARRGETHEVVAPERRDVPAFAGASHEPLGWALLGVGSGLFAAGITTGLVGVRRADGATVGSPAADEARRFAIAGDSLAVIGGVTAAVGGGWLLFAGDGEGEDEVASDVAVVPHGAGLALRGSWNAF